MADRRRTAAAAATYDHVCHILSVSARPDCRAFFTDQTPSPVHFSTRKLSFSDPHAVAVAAALLVLHAASWPLVRRFVRTFVLHVLPEAVPSFDALAVSPFSSRQLPEPATHPRSEAPEPTTCIFDFSANTELTSDGAAAVLAACLLLPTRLHVELSFTLCTRLTSLALQPWLSLLRVERHRSERQETLASLTGLCLDACPVRNFDPLVLSALSDLSWISLRSTRLSNLWRTAEMFDSLTSLQAALLSGYICEHTKLQRTRMCTHSSQNLGDENGSSDTVHRRISGPDTLPSASLSPRIAEKGFVPSEDSSETDDDVKQRREGPSSQHSSHLPPATSARMGEPRPYDMRRLSTEVAATAYAATDGQASHFLRKYELTPVTQAPHFRSFLLARSRTAIRMLDGVTVSSAEREKALRSCRTHFEQPNAAGTPSRNATVMGLLRNREIGVSPRLQLSPSQYPGKECRPKKRRKRSLYTPDFTDVMAAVAAAGIPGGIGAPRLSPSESITVALAATTAAAQQENQRISRDLQRVREAALSIQSASERERLSMLPSRRLENVEVSFNDVAVPSQRKFLSANLSLYGEEAFERCLSSALLHRRGGPRILYLCHGNDRPRQFEYNPANPSELVYGTEHGYLVVMDEESGVVKGSCRSGGGAGHRAPGELLQRTSNFEAWSRLNQNRHCHRANIQSAPVYGLSWLNRTSNLFISGTNNGAIHVYDVNRISGGGDGACRYACETFDQLTSIHVSSDDARFAVSGLTRDVGLFDLETGRRTETMKDCHDQCINVIKFANHSPHVLVTSSFDRRVRKWDLRESRPGGGRRPIFTTRSRTDNVMACFSPDDSYLLVSAVDNEVRQFSACDGQLEREFSIPKTGSRYNFTRSYYMNNRDYIVTGSCGESVVRVYNAKTGAFFTEVDMEGPQNALGRKHNVLSLRANPARKFNFSALLVSPGASMNEAIASVDLHAR